MSAVYEQDPGFVLLAVPLGQLDMPSWLGGMTTLIFGRLLGTSAKFNVSIG